MSHHQSRRSLFLKKITERAGFLRCSSTPGRLKIYAFSVTRTTAAISVSSASTFGGRWLGCPRRDRRGLFGRALLIARDLADPCRAKPLTEYLTDPRTSSSERLLERSSAG
jgi:hypothetical protein